MSLRMKSLVTNSLQGFVLEMLKCLKKAHLLCVSGDVLMVAVQMLLEDSIQGVVTSSR